MSVVFSTQRESDFGLSGTESTETRARPELFALAPRLRGQADNFKFSSSLALSLKPRHHLVVRNVRGKRT